MKKKLLSLIAVCAILFTSTTSLFGCGSASKLIGFDIELAEAVADNLGVKAKFQLIDWRSKETELENKSIDLIWNGLTISPDRLEQMQIGTPYLNNNQVAVIRKSDKDKYTNEENLANARFAFEDGSAGQDVAEEKGYTKKVALNDQMTALTEVKSGTSDIAILDSVLANFYCKSDSSFSDLMIIPDLIFTEEQYGIAARKGDIGTIDKINTALAELQSSGKLTEIARKYGLESELCDVSYTSKWDSLSNAEKSGWEYIKSEGRFVIGYTLYAPIAYKD